MMLFVFQSEVSNLRNSSFHWQFLKVKVKSLSPVWLFATPWTVAYQVPLSMGFSSKGTGVGCHFLLQGIFPTQELIPYLLHWQADALPSEPAGKPVSEHWLKWCWRRVIEKTWLLADFPAYPEQLVAPHPSSSHPWNVHSAWHYRDESHLQGHDLESNVLLRPSGLETWLNLYINFKILEGRDRNLSCDAQDITRKFLCLLNLPPADPEGSALSSLYRG